MPTRKTKTAPGTHQAMKNTAWECIVTGWLMQDGWQVFNPILDHGHQTDILISDGPDYYRVQVKTVEAKNEKHLIENKWKEENHVDVVVYFARNSSWGVITPAFKEKRRPLNHSEHIRFKSGSKNAFLSAFHSI